MKITSFFLALLFSASLFAQEATPKKKYNPYSTAGTWFTIGGSSMLVGVSTRLAGNYIDPPEMLSYMTVDDYNKLYKKYEKGQKRINAVFYGSLMVTSLSMIIGGAELMTIEKKNAGSSVVYKVSATGASVALNF